MRFLMLSAMLGCVLYGQNPGPNRKGPPADPKKVQLVGDRFKPLKWDEMNREQQKMIEDLFAGERGGASGPFNVLLRSPEMGDLIQRLGAQGRYHSGIPDKVKEMAIIMVARHWSAEYEWYAHKRLALEAGLKPDIADAIANRKRPTGMDAEEEVVYNFANELLTTTKVSDATYAAALKMYDEKRIVNLIGVMGYYGIVSMLLNVDRYPLPAGIKPELK